MLTGAWRRIFHYHLMKCGGTTLGRWLDTLTFDERSFRTIKNVPIGEPRLDENGEVYNALVPSLARSLFHWSDVIYRHEPIRAYAPKGTFCFTVLRDPVQRLVSHVADWRRLNDADIIRVPAKVRAAMADARHLSLRDFLAKHGQGAAAHFFDNYITRALAAGRIGNPVANAAEPEDLYEIALQSLENDFDLIGLTEHLDLSRNALCAMVGLPPARRIPTLNVTRAMDDADPELHGPHDVLNELTRVDRMIYRRACELFNQRHRQTAVNYDPATFETVHAGRLLAEARGLFCDGATRFSVRAPIIGSGFDGRDAAGTRQCAVWSGPETRLTLYMPTPPNMALSLLVWIRGYADIRQRAQIRVEVDGQPAAHHFGTATDYADVLTVDARSTKDFVRLDIDLDETLRAGEPGSAGHDPRQRGLSFDSYGWQPMPPDRHPETKTDPNEIPSDIPADVFASILDAEAKLDGWCSREKSLLLVRTILRERPRNCAEIGVFGGRSLIPCAAALRHIGDGAIYGIEAWRTEVAVENPMNNKNDDWWSKVDFATIKRTFYTYIAETRLTQYIRLIEAPSARAAALLDTIDFLHIDGSHSMVNAVEDVLLYVRKMQPGGIVVFDDFHWPSIATARDVVTALCDIVTTMPHPRTGQPICAVLRRR